MRTSQLRRRSSDPDERQLGVLGNGLICPYLWAQPVSDEPGIVLIHHPSHAVFEAT